MWSEISWLNASRRVSISLLILFFASGAAALGYQTVWAKMLGVGLGHELPAVLAVVAAFMGGMALGSWFADARVRSRPARWYIALETLIGVWGLILSWGLPWVNHTVAGWIGLDPSPLRHWSVAFVVPFVALLPATAAMGATFPAMEQLLSRAWLRCVGAVYAANTCGAAAGALGTIFLLAPAVGFRSTLWAVAAVNFACAAAAAVLFGFGRQAATWGGGPASQFEIGNRHLPGPREENGIEGTPRRLAWLLGLTGLLGIGFEVVGVRVLAQVLENTIYTFAMVLGVYLLGTGLGASVYQRWLSHRCFTGVLRGVLLCLAAAIAIELWIMTAAERFYQLLREAWGDSPLSVVVAEMTLALSVFALPTLCMGILFSHLVQAAKATRGGVGRAVALNTLGGATAGAIIGVTLLPWLGASWTLVLIVVGYLVLLPRLRGWQWAWPMAALVLALAAPNPLRSVAVQERVIRWEAGVMATVMVLEDASSNRTLRVNNRFQMGGTAAAAAEYRQAHLPLLLHPQPKRALFLGLGTGITMGGAVVHPGLSSDGVELVPEVVECLDAFEPFNRGLQRRPSTRVFVADARRFLRGCSDVYDVVVGDLFHPGRDGAGALYALEHYRQVKRCLRQDGVFCQWLPLHQMDEPTLRIVIRTFLDVFPDAHAWLLRFNVDVPVIGLISGPGRFSPDWIDRRLDHEPLAQELRRLALADSVRFFGCWLAGPEALRAFASDAPVHTDNRPYVTFRAPAFTYRLDSAPHRTLLHLLELSDTELLGVFESGSGEFLTRVKGYIQARDVYLNGLVAEREGQTDEAFRSFVESARLSSEFTSGYAKCLSAASLWIEARPQEARRLLEALIAARPENPVAAQLYQRWFSGP